MSPKSISQDALSPLKLLIVVSGLLGVHVSGNDNSQPGTGSVNLTLPKALLGVQQHDVPASTVRIKIQHLQSLTEIPIDQALSELAFAVHDNLPEVRLAAIEQVQAIEHPEAAWLLVPLLQDDNLAVRSEAIKGLAVLANAETLMAIESVLFASDLQIQLTAIEAIESIDDQRSIPVLGQLLYVENLDTRLRAMAALSEIAHTKAGRDAVVNLVSPLTGDGEEKIRHLALAITAELQE